MTAIERLMNRKVELRMVPGFETGGHPQRHRPVQNQRRPQTPQQRPRHSAAPEPKNERQPIRYPQTISSR
jgi:hypothetical protein